MFPTNTSNAQQFGYTEMSLSKLLMSIKNFSHLPSFSTTSFKQLPLLKTYLISIEHLTPLKKALYYSKEGVIHTRLSEFESQLYKLTSRLSSLRLGSNVIFCKIDTMVIFNSQFLNMQHTQNSVCQILTTQENVRYKELNMRT